MSAEDLIEDGKFVAVAPDEAWEGGVVQLKESDRKRLGLEDDGEDQIRIVVAIGFFDNRSPKKKDSNRIFLSWGASLTRDGQITPVEGVAPIISDEFYDDSPNKTLAIASRVEAKRFLEEHPCPAPEEGWPVILRYARNYYSAACRTHPKVEGKYLSTRVYAEPADGDAKILNLLRLYDHLEQSESDETALYDTLVSPAPSKLVPSDAILRELAHGASAAHCAHVDRRYGLDPDQRRAVRSLLASEQGSVVAVNGPPGTGKTSMLKALIASVWIAPLLRDKNPAPPLIIATAATNQAVTNIIADLGDNAEEGDAFDRRWLRNINGGAIAPSYGWFFAAKKAADNYPQFMQLTLDKAFPKLTADKAALGVDGNHQALTSRYVGAYLKAISATSGAHTKAFVNQTVLPDLIARLREMWKREEDFYGAVLAYTKAPSDTGRHALVSMANAAANECGVNSSTEDSTLRAFLDAIGSLDAGLWQAYESFIDTSYRRRMFAIGARYWEGRFIVGSRGFSRPENVRHYSMIAPVVVATCNTLPKLLSEYRDGTEHPTFGAADLLIVDEAGQANPPLVAGLFSFARKALVVGDVQQLEPVLKLLESEDNMLLRSSNLSPGDEHVQSLKASQGNIMRLAQVSSSFREEGSPGLTLRRHYRCVPDIIDFCNKNVYGGQLIYVRSNAREPLYGKHVLFVRSNEGGRQAEGSWVNKTEAEAIASWLARERVNIERWADAKGLGSDLADLVGIITPYEPQERRLQEAIQAALTASAASDDERSRTLAMIGRMTIGTVHKLQGAERPIIIFSGTSSADRSRPYYDKDRRLLNVAVSRAKDTFILFGESTTFFLRNDDCADRGTVLLGRHILARGRRLFPRNVVVVESKNKVRKIQRYLGVDHLVLHSGGHIRQLRAGKSGVDVEQAFRPAYNFLNVGQQLLERIRRELPEIDRILLATDADREGDHIAQAIVEALVENDTSHIAIERVRLEAISRSAVIRAFDKPSALDYQAAIAAQTREILDYLIGHLIPTVLQNDEDLRGSSGRVQAAVLALLFSRERSAKVRGERLRLTMGKPDSELVVAQVDLVLPSGAATPHVGALFGLARRERRELILPSAPPSTTVEVIRRAAIEAGFSPSRTMRALQTLFEGPGDVVSASSKQQDQPELPF